MICCNNTIITISVSTRADIASLIHPVRGSESISQKFL